VGVRVDDPGRHDETLDVELAGAVALDEADLDDPPVLHGDIGAAPGQPGAVDHRAVAEHQVVLRHGGEN
jgi:hypothetical protein